MLKKAPKSTASSMRFFSCFENKPAMAAGAVSRASTRIMPATRMSTTTVIATRTSNRYSRKTVLTPMIEANSSSKR